MITQQRNVLRHALGLALFALLGVLVLLRHHLRDLSEVARTYATFYPLLEHHPDVLYRFSATSGEQITKPNEAELIPQNIHQVFLTEGRSTSLTKYEPAITSCQSLHPNWTHNLWVDESATAFISEHYPAILPHYRGYKQSIQRANILRYALLDHFGGVYLDLDITCLQPLDDLRDLPFVSPGAYPAGVNNAFILTRPHHRFLQHLLEGVKSRDLSWGLPYVENMLSTGCMFFSNRWMSYMRYMSARPKDVAPEDRLYILADGTGDIEPHMLRGKVVTPLFEHGGASSWHGWDAAAIVLIGKYYRLLLLGLVMGLVGGVVMIWRCWRGGARRRRQRSMDKTEDREALMVWKEG